MVEKDRLNLQYFSKLKKVWVDFSSTDCEESLRKYGYQVRLNPKFEMLKSGEFETA